MAHAIRVVTGKLSPPQLFAASPAPPPLNFKKRPVSDDDKVNFANKGAGIARNDRAVQMFRELQAEGPRRLGFDMGMGITAGDKEWGPGKQLFGDIKKGGLGQQAMTPASARIRSELSRFEHVLLMSDASERGFDAAVAFHVSRRR
jgi:hypothetical protein